MDSLFCTCLHVMCLKAAETKGLLQILPWALAVQQLADTAVHVQ